MKIAVIGSGISGLGAAFVLQREHDVTLFERSDRPGGHTHTLDVAQNGMTYPVDTGFVVFNETTYPNFSSLLALAPVWAAAMPVLIRLAGDSERNGYRGISSG